MAELVVQSGEVAVSHEGTPVIPMEETPSKKTSIASSRVSKVSTRRLRQVSSVTHRSAYNTALEQEDNNDSIVKFQVSKLVKKAPLQSIYVPEWESVRISYFGTGYNPKPIGYGQPTPAPISSTQRVKIEGSIKTVKVKESQLKLSHERVRAEFLRTFDKSLPSSYKPIDTDCQMLKKLFVLMKSLNQKLQLRALLEGLEKSKNLQNQVPVSNPNHQ